MAVTRAELRLAAPLRAPTGVSLALGIVGGLGARFRRGRWCSCAIFAPRRQHGL